MTTVTETFSPEEIKKISNAKNFLQTVLKSANVFECQRYDIKSEKRIGTPVLDDESPSMVVAGGVISSLLLNGAVHDIDVFILNLNMQLFADLVGHKTGPWVVKHFFDENEDPRGNDYQNPHVFATATNKETKVQYILTDHKDRKSLLEDFDYIHCTASYHEGKLFINRQTYDAIHKKRLIRQNKNKQPKQWRENKFIQRGWRSESDVVFSESKTLKDILSDNLKQLKNSSPNSIWWDNTVNSITANQTKAIHGADIAVEDILADLDPYLQTK